MTSEPPHDVRSDASTGAAPQGQSPAPAEPVSRGVKRTRAGAVWVAVGSFAVILVLLLIFILENTQRVDISYFGVHVHAPLGVALLLAAVLGVILAAIPATWRMAQLRTAAHRRRRSAAK